MSKPTEEVPLPPFEGFRPQAMVFLEALKDNQNKEWFGVNRGEYEQFLRGPLQSLVADVSEQLRKAKSPLYGDPKHALFRINRDVRFTKDKRPYNTHVSAALTRDGEKNSPGVLYIHIDPAGSFVASGFFRPDPPILHTLREGLVGDPAGWAKVERALSRGGLTLVTDDKLVRAPKGFEDAPEQLAEVLKLKSWVVTRNLTSASIERPRLVDEIVGLAKDAVALLNFGWKALG